MADRHQNRERIRQFAEACLACHAACVETSMHLAEKGDVEDGGRCQQRLADCASICHAAAGFLLRGSPYAEQALSMCADVCEACVAECEPLRPWDATVSGCVMACRECEAVCREVEALLV